MRFFSLQVLYALRLPDLYFLVKIACIILEFLWYSKISVTGSVTVNDQKGQ